MGKVEEQMRKIIKNIYQGSAAWARLQSWIRTMRASEGTAAWARSKRTRKTAL